MNKLQLLIFLLMTPATAFAYIGPGAGLGAIITFVAIALGVLLLLVGFLWYPLKRMLGKRKVQSQPAIENAQAPQTK